MLNGKTALLGREFTYQQIAAVSVIIALFLLQWRGVKWGSNTQLLTSALKAGAFIVVVVACFLFGGHSRGATPSAALLPLKSGWPLVASMLLALQAVVYAVDGWDGVVYFGEEVRNPGREIPRTARGTHGVPCGRHVSKPTVSSWRRRCRGSGRSHECGERDGHEERDGRSLTHQPPLLPVAPARRQSALAQPVLRPRLGEWAGASGQPSVRQCRGA